MGDFLFPMRRGGPGDEVEERARRRRRRRRQTVEGDTVTIGSHFRLGERKSD